MAKNKHSLLIVEDDPGVQSALRWTFDGYDVEVAGEREAAINALRRAEPGVVLLDLGLPPDPGGVSEGLATLDEILSLAPDTKVIVITGDSDRKNAVKAIGRGAYDFYQKPVESDVLSLIVDRAYAVHQLELENKRLSRFEDKMPLEGIIAASPEMLAVCRKVEKVAPTDITTLLLGASGTGKERFAQAIHDLSLRSGKKIVAINCAAIPENLLESELFGYEKGAFTGATSAKTGRIEYADGGTLFLDEIGDMPMELQAKMLRFLQERVVEKVGGLKTTPVDVRIICATHQKLPQLIEEGRFREDLYYRISEITIDIPSLKDRQGDVLVLAKVFLERFAQEMNSKVSGFDPEATQAIEHYDWPGNVRELESRIKRAAILAEGSLVGAEDLELDTSAGDQPIPLNLRQVREEAETRAIERALSHCNDNMSEAANLLGITRPTLYDLMSKYGMR